MKILKDTGMALLVFISSVVLLAAATRFVIEVFKFFL